MAYSRRPPIPTSQAILAAIERLEQINAGISGSAHAEISLALDALKQAVRTVDGRR
jgi:hypothetical protein